MKTTKEVATFAEVKKNIRALLISAPRGLSVDDIEHDYHAMLGKPLPFKQFRCRTALEFLKTMPDVVCATWSNGVLILKGIADESSKHIAKLVSRQRVNACKSRRIFKAPVSTKPLVVPHYFRKNIKELLSVYPNGVLGSSLSTAYSRYYGEEIEYAKLGFRSMSELLNSVQDIASIVKNPKGGYRICAIVKRSKPKTPPAVRKQNSLLPAPKVTSSRPPTQIVPPSKTPSSNARLSKATAPSSAYVIPSRRRTLTDLNSLEGNVASDRKKIDRDQRNSENVKDMLNTKSGVSESLKDELISVLSKRTNGVWAARLPFEYKMLMGKDLNFLALGFFSVIEMASSMPDVFRTERPFPNGDWLLFLSAKTKKDKNITKVYLPENAIGKGVGYRQQDLPEENYLELYVTHIKTPECFWVQLIKYAQQLEELQKDMREFYSSKESAQFVVDDSLVKLGQVCVARFPVDREWYRGLITGTPSQLLIEVFYVDYGNSSQVSKSDLRLMKKEFFQLPSQSIKGKLVNIKPKMSTWDPSVAHRMNELTENKPLVGLVTGKRDGVLDLSICDTNGKDDIYINDRLVEERYAKFKQVNGRTTPPGLPPPEANQSEINQQITLNTLQLQTPTFPDYSTPLNVFTGYQTYDLSTLLNIAPAEQPLLQIPEKIPPIIDEEKPSEEDLEFMRQVCDELANEDVVKTLRLPGKKVIHVINFEEKAFVVRPEISALLWESDQLRSMLRTAKMDVEKLIISREDHEELFDELRRLQVGDYGEGEEAREYATLYPLSAIPGILEKFNHPLPELVKIIKNEVATFEESPGTYWGKGNDNNEEGTDDSCPSESEEHDLEELKLAEQALQFARKRILRAMMNGDLTPGGNTVDEANKVEERIAHIRDLITKAEAKEASKDTEGSNETKVEQEDKVVDNDGGESCCLGNVVSEALSTQPEQPPVRPVGVTKPEVRQPSPVFNGNHSTSQSAGIHTITTQHPGIPTSTLQSTPHHPDIPTSTPRHPSIPTSTPQSTLQHPDIPTSTPQHPGIPAFTPEHPGILTSTSQYPNIPTSTSRYPEMTTFTPQCPQHTSAYRNLDVFTPQNPHLHNAVHHNPTEDIGSYVDRALEATDQRGTTVKRDTSVDRQKKYKDLVETAKQTIERISLENIAQGNSENMTSKKRSRSSSHPNYVTLPPPQVQPMGGLPMFIPGGHVTSFPNGNFPFPGVPPNVRFQGFMEPFHPLPPPSFTEFGGMHLFGPLSAPSLVSPSQLLFQYGSPFPNQHPRRGQR